MNFLEQQRLVSAVAIAARDGVTSALKKLVSSGIAPTPAARRFPPAFSHLTGSTVVKPPVAPKITPRAATVKVAAPRARKHDFSHLVAIGQPAAVAFSATAARAVSEQRRQASAAPSTPSPAALSRAHADLALQRGALAHHACRPSPKAVEAAAAVVTQQDIADAATAAQRARAASMVAAKILAAGGYRGVRRP